MATRQHVTADQFTQVLARMGVSPNTVKARIRAEMTWGQLIRGKFGASLQVGESDIAAALRDRSKPPAESDTVGYVYTLYPVIVVAARGSSKSHLESKLREAENLRSRFVTCKEGLAMARALRDVAVREPVTRSSADLPEQLRNLLASSPLGHLTAPEATAQGLQMFALCDKKETKTDSPIKHELQTEIYTKRFEAESKRYLDEIRKSAMIEYK
jgi:peptidyl-prolyl cis-trans isomerase SurA